MDDEVIFDGEELFQFHTDILVYSGVVKQNPMMYTERQFLDWLAIRAAQLHAHYVLEPEIRSLLSFSLLACSLLRAGRQ